MSKDKLDILGETHLPSDLLTPTMSTNYLLDGYPDMEYGLGVLEGDQPPGSSPSPEYKITSFRDDAAGIHLDEMMKDSSLQDLSWLELVEQDPNRLPENPAATAVPELEEAWGTERRTDGVHFYPNRDLEQARYEESLKDASEKKPKVARRELQRVIRKAMRRSAAGHGLKELLTEAAQALGEGAPLARSAMEIVKDEHGLAGNVFIRAAAYPGYEKGKWTETIRRHAKNAKYIIVSEAEMEGSVHIQDGYCSVTKKKAVTDVPWEEAFALYAPKLKAAGYKLASGDKRSALKSAFLSLPEKLDTPDRFLPTHKTPSERISLDEARKRFAQMNPEERQVYTRDQKIAERKRQAAQVRVAKWAKANLISKENAAKIAGSGLSGEEMLRVATARVLATKGADAFSGVSNDVRPPDITLKQAREALKQVETPEAIDISHRPIEARRRKVLARIAQWTTQGLLTEKDARRLAASSAPPLVVMSAATHLAKQTKGSQEYSGAPNDTREAAKQITAEEVWAQLRQVEEREKKAQAKVDQEVQKRRAKSTRAARKIATVEEKVAEVKAAIDKGVKGQPLRDFIARTIPRDSESRRLATKMLTPVLKESGALDATPTGPQTYQGRAYRQVPQKVATVTPHMREVEGMLKWVREAMNEGFAGKDLDKLIKTRFTSSVIKSGSDQLAQLRREHEGAAGYIYVDASAYASETGTKGCDKGALKHRANGVSAVLAMDRCAGCALRKVKADGIPVCTKYNKMLASAEDLPDQVEHMKAANIKAANMTDVEATASYFAPAYDPSEFDLHNANLDEVEVPEHNTETISEVLFGGMEW